MKGASCSPDSVSKVASNSDSGQSRAEDEDNNMSVNEKTNMESDEVQEEEGERTGEKRFDHFTGSEVSSKSRDNDVHFVSGSKEVCSKLNNEEKCLKSDKCEEDQKLFSCGEITVKSTNNSTNRLKNVDFFPCVNLLPLSVCIKRAKKENPLLKVHFKVDDTGSGHKGRLKKSKVTKRKMQMNENSDSSSSESFDFLRKRRRKRYVERIHLLSFF